MKVFVFLLLLTLPCYSSAQKKQGQARLDSLLKGLGSIAEDSTGVKLLVNISYVYCSINPDEGLKFADRALTLAGKIGWRTGEALAGNELGNNYQNKGAYSEALEQFFKALRIYEEAGAPGPAGLVSSNIGTVYYFRQSYAKALEYYQKSAKAAYLTKDSAGQQLASGNIGMVYYSMHRYPEALSYMQRSLRLAEHLEDKRGIVGQLCNISNIYGEQNDNSAALLYAFKALRLAESIGDKQTTASAEVNIGLIYLDIAQHPEQNLPDSLVPAGRKANLTKAILYLESGIQHCRESSNNEALIELLQALSRAQSLQGDYRSALKVHEQYTVLKDSIHNLESGEKIADMETERAVELKDKDLQIARLSIAKKRTERLFYLGGIAVLLVIVGIIANGFRRQRRSNKLLSSEKQRSDTLLLNILPAEVAEELKERGSSAARQYKDVSVLFTDFVNFTGTSESLDAQALVAELNTCFTAFDAIIERTGLEKIKTIGDAYMAVCGLPQEDEQHARKTIEAALGIRDFIAARRLAGKGLELRIGISSGPAIAGIVGTRKFAFDIWGDTVNTAARMEQHGAAGRINISYSTYELVKDVYTCEYRGRVAAKNKGEIDMYFVGARIGDLPLPAQS
jgi:adenylate cyclase